MKVFTVGFSGRKASPTHNDNSRIPVARSKHQLDPKIVIWLRTLIDSSQPLGSRFGASKPVEGTADGPGNHVRSSPGMNGTQPAFPLAFPQERESEESSEIAIEGRFAAFTLVVRVLFWTFHRRPQAKVCVANMTPAIF